MSAREWRRIQTTMYVIIATAISLSTRQQIFRVWNENFLWSAPSYFVGAGVAAISAWMVIDHAHWLAGLATAPLYLTYRTYLKNLEASAEHGLPLDADIVMDVRFLPNPHWVESLRPLPGTDPRHPASSCRHD